MKLYGYFRSSSAYRVRIALNLKGLTIEHQSVHLRKGEQSSDEYACVNAQRLVPALVHDGMTLTQSLSIIEYLDELHPYPPLLPPYAYGRAWVRSLAQVIACDTHPLNNLRVLNYLKDEFGADAEKRQVWYEHWIKVGLSAVESMLSDKPKSGPFCYGDQPTLADICLVPQVYNAERMNCPMASYPHILEIVARCRDLPAFANASPEKQPDYDL